MIRAATARDLSSIASIYNEGIRGRNATFETTDRSIEDVTPWLDDAESPLVVAEDGVVQAWARAATYRARAAYLGVRDVSVYVTAPARGRGAGSALIASLIDACERLDYFKLVARLFPENTASRALFRRNGFREVGLYERHGQLDGAWRDVLIVERLIGRGRP
jgi:L-amino acid N-acyltransferase YncA